VKRLLQARKGLPLSQYSTAQVTDFLKNHVSPKLSGHSFKRGALQYLLEQGIPLSLIADMARHARQDWIPMATRVYLPAIPLALAGGTQKATRLL
jgi:hypothetical protein